MPSLKYLNTILTILAIILALNLYVTVFTGPSALPQAHAQGIPDEGAQRVQIIDQLKLLNQKLEQLKGLLESGKVKVVVTNAPDAPAQSTR